MDYKEKYERSLKIAKDYYKANQKLGDSEENDLLSDIFPELKESEDERIRKTLIEYFNAYPKDYYCELKTSCIIAWLEKQGEKKPSNKVEPKFHEGEWITNGDYTWKIVEIKPLDYILQSQDGNIVDDTISHVDEQFHSFTIEDAKDGDVLYSPCLELLWIFKGRGTVYCGCNLNYNDGAFCGEGYIEMPTDAIPATKEQHDTLMKAMTDAGWEFDFDKKELKKISQRMISAEAKEAMYDKPTDEEMKELLRTEYEKGRADAIAEMQKGWSEEDETRLQVCIDCLQAKSLMGKVDTVMTNWLKSLKDRCTWKPSDGQMKALHNLNLTGNISYAGQGQELVELYNDLLKV